MKLILLALTTLLGTAHAMDSNKQIRHQSHRASQDHRAAGIGSGSGPAACEGAIAQVNPSLDACGIPNSVASVAGLSATQTQCICAIDMTQIGLACAAQADVTAVLTQLQGLCSGAPAASSSPLTTAGTGFGGFLAPAASAGQPSGVTSGPPPTGVTSGPASGTGTASAASRSASAAAVTGAATAVTTIPPATTGSSISTIALPKSSANGNGSLALFALTACMALLL